MAHKVADVEYDRRDIVGWGPSGSVVMRGAVGSSSVAKSVAVKRLLTGQCKVLDEQFKLFGQCAHANVVRFITVAYAPSFTYLALELCACNLADYVSGRYAAPAPLTNRDILEQTTQGVAYLHSIGAVHRNLKPTNVLISALPADADADENADAGRRVTVKLSDFGIVSVSGGKWPGGDAESSEGWQAPELIKCWPASSVASVGPPVDIFALGCLYYSVLTKGQHPFGALAYFREQKALGGQYDLEALSRKLPVAAILVECMIHRSPEYRPSIDEVMAQSNFWSLDFA